MRVIFACGGTAGHINPAIAVAGYIREKHKDAQILFVGAKIGMEKDLVPKAGFKIEFIEAQGLKRKITLDNLKALFQAAVSYRKSRKIIKNFKPDIVIGTGGYVSGPVLAAAARMKIPTLIHEQNVFAGVTSKMLSGMVDVVAVAFAEAEKMFPKAKKIVHTGNPVRPELLAANTSKTRSKPLITAFGGSLGAEKFNEAVINLIKYSSNEKSFDMIFGTGERNYKAVSDRLEKLNLMCDNIKVVPYIHNMAEAMASADLVISRSGAITLSELNALGKPSILVPSPNVTDNHQEHNARALEKEGAAVVITEDQFADNRILLRKATELLDNKEKLSLMSKKSAGMGIKNASEKIYGEIITLINNKDQAKQA